MIGTGNVVGKFRAGPDSGRARGECAIPGRSRLKHPGSADAERGITLLEAALAISLFGSLITLGSAIISEETRRQRNISLGKDLRLMTEAAQAFIAGEYGALIARLPSLPAGEAAISIHPRELVAAGYLADAFLVEGNAENSSGQSYLVLARAVDLADGTVPRLTLTTGDLDADGDGAIDPDLVDGQVFNGELFLEAILATSGGDPVAPQDGNPAVVAAESAFAGYVTSGSKARGPFGSWVLDISPYYSLAGNPVPGRFVSLLALPGIGTFGMASGGERRGGQESHPLERCLGLTGRLLQDCASGNAMYTGIAFTSFDQDGDGNIDRTGSIRNLYELSMGAPADTSGDGGIDEFGRISGLASIECEAGVRTYSVGTLLVDCPEVSFTGDVSVGGGLSTHDGIESGGAVEAPRFFADAIGGQDLTKGVYSVELVAMDPEMKIQKPECSDPDSDAEVFAVPSAFASPEGASLLGVLAYAEESDSGNEWRIRMEAAVDSDENHDGIADVVELESTEDYALVISKCS